MMLLDYLIPSRTRRSLLGTLRGGGSLTVRQLSKAARVPYSAAHREIARLSEADLVHRTRDGSAWRCSWNAGHPLARTLAVLLQEARGPAVPGEAAVVANLKRWGAPLAEEARSRERLSLEDTLAHAIRLSRRRPEVLRSWPLVLAQHCPSIDLHRLRALAGRLGEKKALGFLLALSGRLLRNPRLSMEADRLRDGRARTVENYFLEKEGPRAARLTELRTPPIARRWLFRLNMPMHAFENHFRKFRRLS